MKQWLVMAYVLLQCNGLLAATAVEQGRALAEDRNKGNCLSCHFVQGAEMTGTIAPPLISMKIRFPDRQVLRSQIFDATKNNPDSVMPPYGKHSILTEQDIDQVVEFVYTL